MNLETMFTDEILERYPLFELRNDKYYCILPGLDHIDLIFDYYTKKDNQQWNSLKPPSDVNTLGLIVKDNRDHDYSGAEFRFDFNFVFNSKTYSVKFRTNSETIPDETYFQLLDMGVNLYYVCNIDGSVLAGIRRRWTIRNIIK